MVKAHLANMQRIRENTCISMILWLLSTSAIKHVFIEGLLIAQRKSLHWKKVIGLITSISRYNIMLCRLYNYYAHHN